MPWAVRIDSKRRVSYATLLGIVTFQDIAAMQAALAAEADFDPRVPLVVDMREAEDLRLTWPELQHVIEHSPLLDDTRRAVLVDVLNVLGTARVFEMAREKKTASRSLRVVKTVEDAAEWLGVKALNP
jgi:hypothetical protein